LVYQDLRNFFLIIESEKKTGLVEEKHLGLFKKIECVIQSVVNRANSAVYGISFTKNQPCKERLVRAIAPQWNLSFDRGR